MEKSLSYMFFVFLFFFYVFEIKAQDAIQLNYPTFILHKDFASQWKVSDSVRWALFNKDPKLIVPKLNKLINWAGENGDLQLKFRFELIKLSYLNDQDIPETEIEEKYTELFSLIEENKLQYLKAEALQFLAQFYWKKKKFALALENYLYANTEYSKFSIESFPEKAEFLFELGGRYYYFRDYVTAKRYFLEFWRTIPYSKIDNKISKMNTMALCYGNMELYDSSSYYFQKAMDLAIKDNDETWIGIISGNLGNNCFKQKKYDEAMTLLEKNIEISTKRHLMEDLAVSLSQYGELLLIKGDPKKALETELKSLEIVKLKGLFHKLAFITRIYPNVAKAYAANGNYEMAFAYLDTAYQVKDAFESERNAVFVSGVQHKIDVEKHKAEMQKTEEEIKQQNIIRNSIIAVFLIVLFAFLSFYFQQKKLKLTQIKLLQSEKMAALGQLSANIAHEVNTPLGAIRSSAEESSRAFEEIFTDFIWFSQTLKDEEKNAFFNFVGQQKTNIEAFSTKEEREIKRKLRDELSELGIENARFLSDKLVQVGIFQISDQLKELTKSQYFDKLVMLTYNIRNQNHCNQTIQLAVDKASRIVKALKTYVHTSNSEEVEAINIRENIETVLTIYNNRLKQGIKVIKNYEQVPEIYGSPDQLNQVWTNLIVNAVQAMDNNGILTIDIKEEGDHVTVSIRDTGKGIPKNIQEKIFEPFFTTKSSGEGTGLGLHIIKRILKDQNASISFNSVEGEGTIFYVKFPINKIA
ncbi:MAG: ATP-binding protein [Saprospiraceae bacterium]